MTDEVVCIYQANNVCGEGPVWDAEEQALYWIDITDPKLYKRREGDGLVTSWPIPCTIGALALRKAGGAIVALRTGFAFFDFESGKAETIVDPEKDIPNTRFNDGKCDKRGRFWCGTCHEVTDPNDRRPIGSLYRLDPDLSCHRMLGEIRTSNGIDWSPDGRTMYYTDTPTLRIDAFEFDVDSNTLGSRRMFAEIPSGAGRPDGLTVDAEGYIWSAHFDGWRVTRYEPNGSVDRVIQLPVKNVTSCAFGGADLKTLYITTATEDLSPEELIQQPLAGGLFALRTTVSGLPMNKFGG
jgi:sugar lactone lactonase YvrE